MCSYTGRLCYYQKQLSKHTHSDTCTLMNEAEAQTQAPHINFKLAVLCKVMNVLVVQVYVVDSIVCQVLCKAVDVV